MDRESTGLLAVARSLQEGLLPDALRVVNLLGCSGYLQGSHLARSLSWQKASGRKRRLEGLTCSFLNTLMSLMQFALYVNTLFL